MNCMKATFYIIPQSFSSEGISLSEIINRMSSFLAEYATMYSFCEDNDIIVDKKIYETVLPDGMSLGEYIYNNEDAKGEERDLKYALQNILQRHQEDLDLKKICEQINNNSIENCYGIISMVPIKGVADKSQIIYDKGSWYDFRRYHLGVFHGDAVYFIEECRKYYPCMFFHEHNKESVNSILKDYAQTIIFHLNGIHDILPILMKVHTEFNQTELLKELSKKANFPEIATVQGSNKEKLKFKFKLDCENREIDVLCELHVKMCYDDSNNGKYHTDNRIYFHKGRKDIAGGRILIAHIGKHL